jgi:hypothetical protein
MVDVIFTLRICICAHNQFSGFSLIPFSVIFKCDELASRTYTDLNSCPCVLPQNLDKNQNLDKQINSFHIQITFCYQLSFRIPKEFQKNYKKIQKKFQKNSQDFVNIKFPTSHLCLVLLWAQNDFGPSK